MRRQCTRLGFASFFFIFGQVFSDALNEADLVIVAHQNLSLFLIVACTSFLRDGLLRPQVRARFFAFVTHHPEVILFRALRGLRRW